MADFRTSHEIEDVLSSIRRLVSEDLRPAARPAEAVASGSRLTLRPVMEPSAGKLILTAALRVEEPAQPAPETQAASVAAVNGPVEDLADAVWAAAGEDEAVYVEDIDPATAPVSPARGHWTAETMPDVAWTQPDEDWAADGPVSFFAHHRRSGQAPEPAGTDQEDLVVEAVTAAVTDTLSDQGFPASDASAPIAAGAGQIDAGLLRDTVRQIIREELAGSLGERITRNVRKLVRIEVNRALAAREFE